MLAIDTSLFLSAPVSWKVSERQSSMVRAQHLYEVSKCATTPVSLVQDHRRNQTCLRVVRPSEYVPTAQLVEVGTGRRMASNCQIGGHRVHLSAPFSQISFAKSACHPPFPTLYAHFSRYGSVELVYITSYCFQVISDWTRTSIRGTRGKLPPSWSHMCLHNSF